MTVEEMLLGKKVPMSTLEFTYWGAYFNEKAEIERKANGGKQTKTAEIKKAMGNTQYTMDAGT